VNKGSVEMVRTVNSGDGKVALVEIYRGLVRKEERLKLSSTTHRA
jgi:hypothetical protein